MLDSLISRETKHVCKGSLAFGQGFGSVGLLFGRFGLFLLWLLSDCIVSFLWLILVWEFEGFLLFRAERIVVNQAVQKSENSWVGWNTFEKVFGVDTVLPLSYLFELFQKILPKILSSSGHGGYRLCFRCVGLILLHNGSDSVKREKELIFDI